MGKGSGHWECGRLPYSSVLSAVCEAHFLKPDGDRGQSLALRRDPTTQVTKAKRDTQLKQGNHLLHNGVFRGCHASLPRSERVRRGEFAVSSYISLYRACLCPSAASGFPAPTTHCGSQDAVSATLKSRILI